MIHIINQPWDGRGARMGDWITRLLASDMPRFEIFRACVAFAKASGVLRLAPALQSSWIGMARLRSSWG